MYVCVCVYLFFLTNSKSYMLKMFMAVFGYNLNIVKYYGRFLYYTRFTIGCLVCVNDFPTAFVAFLYCIHSLFFFSTKQTHHTMKHGHIFIGYITIYIYVQYIHI